MVNGYYFSRTRTVSFGYFYLWMVDIQNIRGIVQTACLMCNSCGKSARAKTLRLLQQFVGCHATRYPVSYLQPLPTSCHRRHRFISAAGALIGTSGLCPCPSSQANANRTVCLSRQQLRSTSCKEWLARPAAESRPLALAFCPPYTERIQHRVTLVIV